MKGCLVMIYVQVKINEYEEKMLCYNGDCLW